MALGEHKRNQLVSFDDIDYEDPKQVRQAQESMIREQYIRIAALGTVRRALDACVDTHRESHQEMCKPLAEKYLAMLPTHKVFGYSGYQRNDPMK